MADPRLLKILEKLIDSLPTLGQKLNMCNYIMKNAGDMDLGIEELNHVMFTKGVLEDKLLDFSSFENFEEH